MTEHSRRTLTDVAKRAGVSVASVSRVLNGLSASPAMTERVQDAVEKLNYVPDATARSLKVGRTQQLALAVADIGNPVYVEMMRAVETVVRKAGYRLVLSSTGSNPEEDLSLLKSLAHGYADGLILSPLRITPELLRELQAVRVPVVVIGTVPKDAGVDSVRANSARGIALAVQHLARTGRRIIAFINGPLDTVPGAARQKGFDRATRQIGLEIDQSLHVFAQDFTFQAGKQAAQILLDNGTPDALICANDLLAVAAMHELAKRKLKVPEDVAVVGIDNTELADLAFPTLTSVDLGSAERGRIAAELLLDRLDQPTREPRQKIVQPRLVTRQSTS